MAAPTRQCPECGGRIHAIAGRCKHCKAELAAPEAAAPAIATTLPAQPAGHGSPAPTAASAWARRWPVVAMALALLVIGASVGVLVERWLRSNDSSELRRRLPGNSPHEVPDRMPGPRPAGPR